MLAIIEAVAMPPDDRSDCARCTFVSHALRH